MNELRLQLKRPLVCFDLETTGTNSKKDRIVEIAAIIVHPDGDQETYETLVNPEIPIPEACTRVHGITNEAVANAPTLSELSDDMFDVFFNVDFAGFNIAKFDIPLLQNEFDRCGIAIDLGAGCVVDAFRIFKHYQRHTLADAVRFYLDQDMENAHEAIVDVEYTLDVLAAQIVRYDLPDNVARLSDGLKPPGAVDEQGKLREQDGKIVIAFGKHQNTPLDQVPKSYIHWLIREDVIPDQVELLRSFIPKPKKVKLR